MRHLAKFAFAGASLLFVVFASAAEISGAWNVEGNIMGYPINAVCTFLQAESKLSGKCKTDAAESELSGEVVDKTVTWTYSMDSNGQVYTLVFKGNLESVSSIKGTLEVAGGQGEFIATKQ